MLRVTAVVLLGYTVFALAFGQAAGQATGQLFALASGSLSQATASLHR